MELMNIIKALAHENRLRILNILKTQQPCVCELENILKINQSNASRHLHKLKQAGIIKARRDAQWIHYYLNEELLNKHPFLRKLIEKELARLEICQEDEQRLDNYLQSDLTCDDLTNRDIDLDEIY